jgi:flagella basal body P-ring formation protein FlgA
VELAVFTGDELRLSMAQIRETLAEHQAHWGLINLRGAMQITVRRGSNVQPATSDATAPRATDSVQAAAPRANPLPAVSVDAPAVDTGRTVRDIVQQYLEDAFNRTAGDDLRIDFNQPTNPAWRISESDYQLQLKPVTGNLLGRVAFVITLYRGGEPAGEHRLSVDVAALVEGVVATRRLQRNQTLTSRDLVVQARWVDDTLDNLLPTHRLPIGKTVVRLVREGDLLRGNDVAAPVVVKRGQLIKARYLAGNLVLTVYCRASEDGRIGDVIKLRSGRNRETYHGRIVGPHDAVLSLNDQPGKGGPS